MLTFCIQITDNEKTNLLKGKVYIKGKQDI